MMKIEIQAPAKVNLFLNVLGKRPDGYHDIRSLLAPVSLYDRIIIETRGKGVETVLVGGPVKLDGIPWPASMPDSENNLATHAARALKAATGYTGGARMAITKNIPVAGGLGGGSSDAAAVLKGLNRAWRTGMTKQDLMKLAGTLGSDIPALVHGGLVLMEGRGEIITPIEAEPAYPLWMLLVNPGLEISTAEIYSRYRQDLTLSTAEDKLNCIISGLRDGCIKTIGKGLLNSLQHTSFSKYPLLRLIKNELERAGSAGVLLSGSGATILALAHDREHGLNIERRIKKGVSCPIWTSLVKLTCA